MTEHSPSHRAGPPPVHRSTHDHAERPHTHRPPQSNFSLVFGMLIAVAAVGLFAILALMGREHPPTFSELKHSLGIPASGTANVPDLDQVDFSNRLDRISSKRQAQSHDARYLYLYYKVQEGQAQIILDRGAWEVGKARIKRIALR